MSGLEKMDELIEKIVDAERCFRRACSQIIVFNRVLNDLQTRYDMALKQEARVFRYTLRVRIAVLEGVRNMFYEFATMKADLIVELRKQIQHEHETAHALYDDEDDDELLNDFGDEYDLSDSELEYSDFDFSDYEDEFEVSALNNSILVAGEAVEVCDNTNENGEFINSESAQEKFEIVKIANPAKETDLNGTELSIDSGYLDDSNLEDEMKDL